MTTNTSNRQSKTAISDLEFDFVTVLHNKAEAPLGSQSLMADCNIKKADVYSHLL